MADTASMGPVAKAVLLIVLTLFPFSGAENTTENFEGLLDTTAKGEIIGVTTEDSVGNSSTNTYAKYIFGMPPIPIDPAINGVESDDDFETLVPFTPEQIYNKDWFLSGFDKESHPVFVRTVPRITDASLKLFSNSTTLKLLRKVDRYQKYIITKAIKIRSTKEKPVTQYVLINDFIHTNSYAPLVTNPDLVRWLMHNEAASRRFHEKYRKIEIVINAGVVGELAGRIYARVGARHRSRQVYGPNKAEWLRALQRQFPRDQLPEEYGGFKGHVPIKLYPD